MKNTLLFRHACRVWARRAEWAPGLLLFGLAAAVLFAVFRLTDLDLVVQRWFHQPGAADRGWFLKRVVWARMATAFGTLPALAVAAWAFIRLCRDRWRSPAEAVRMLALLLTFAVGPGLLVNGILKANAGRPRPVQVAEFGGPAPFVRPYETGLPGTYRSFPCGHASAGFYVATLYWFLPRGRRRGWFFGVGMALGLWIGLARMAAGAHFLSDVAWAAWLVAWVAFCLHHWVFGIPDWEAGRVQGLTSRASRRRLLLAMGAVLAAIGAGVVMATPVYREDDFPAVALDPASSRLVVETERCTLDLEFSTGTLASVSYDARGFGLPWSKFVSALATNDPAAGPGLLVRCRPRGVFVDIDASLRVTVPSGVRNLDVRVRDVNLSLATPPPHPPSVRLIRTGGKVEIPAGWETFLREESP